MKRRPRKEPTEPIIGRENRRPVWCQDADGDHEYIGGFRVAPLPGADDQARRMR